MAEEQHEFLVKCRVAKPDFRLGEEFYPESGLIVIKADGPWDAVRQALAVRYGTNLTVGGVDVDRGTNQWRATGWHVIDKDGGFTHEGYATQRTFRDEGEIFSLSKALPEVGYEVGFEVEAQVTQAVNEYIKDLDGAWEPLDESFSATEAEAQDAIEQVKALGPEWATARYRIVPAARESWVQ